MSRLDSPPVFSQNLDIVLEKKVFFIYKYIKIIFFIFNINKSK